MFNPLLLVSNIMMMLKSIIILFETDILYKQLKLGSIIGRGMGCA